MYTMKDFLLNNIEVLKRTHEGSWLFVAILFFVTVFLYKKSLNKYATISQIILRIFFLLMILSGLGMIIAFNFPLFYTVKGIIAIIMVGFMEVCCGRLAQNTPYSTPFIASTILLIVVILMGFRIITF